MPTFGKLDEYNETEDWRHYIERARVNFFFLMQTKLRILPSKDPFFWLVWEPTHTQSGRSGRSEG